MILATDQHLKRYLQRVFNNLLFKNKMVKYLSLAGGGFNCIYQLGVIKALLASRHYANLCVIGVSSGSLVAIAYVAKLDCDLLAQDLKSTCATMCQLGWLSIVYSWHKVEMMAAVVYQHLKNKPRITWRRLTIVYSTLYGPVFATTWVCTLDVIACSMASQSIPFIQDLPRIYRATLVLDGGLYQSQPYLPSIRKSKAICIGYGIGTLRSNLTLPPLSTIQIPSPARFDQLFNAGYRDARLWLEIHDR